jgi:CheY-like chemotaxis protein
VAEALAAGFDKHLAKPLSFPDLLAAIGELTK